MINLTQELIEELSKTTNGFYSWDYVAGLAVWILGVEANNERLQARVQELEQLLNIVYQAGMKADEEGDLTEYIDGSLLDKINFILPQPPKEDE